VAVQVVIQLVQAQVFQVVLVAVVVIMEHTQAVLPYLQLKVLQVVRLQAL
jgi:hypothetical protein